MKMKVFKVKGSDDVHTVDSGNNHFINGVCVNPLKDSPDKVGSTIPPESERIYQGLQVTGYVPHKIVDGKFINQIK